VLVAGTVRGQLFLEERRPSTDPITGKVCHPQTHCGIPPEFKFFNWLEDGVCTEIKENLETTDEQAELSALRSRRWADVELSFAQVGSSATELRPALGDEGGYSLLRVIRCAGDDDRVFFSVELIGQAGFE
jgi:hypothetical protein